MLGLLRLLFLQKQLASSEVLPLLPGELLEFELLLDLRLSSFLGLLALNLHLGRLLLLELLLFSGMTSFLLQLLPLFPL